MIPFYDFGVRLIEVEKGDTFSDIRPSLRYLPIPTDILEDIEDSIRNGGTDGGRWIRSFPRKRFILLILPHRNAAERIDTICHEKRHIEDVIIQFCELEGIEAHAYLAGFLGKKLLS